MPRAARGAGESTPSDCSSRARCDDDPDEFRSRSTFRAHFVQACPAAVICSEQQKNPMRNIWIAFLASNDLFDNFIARVTLSFERRPLIEDA